MAATDRHIAEEALKLIEVDYDVLPTVLTLHDAMQPDAPLLHEAMTTRFRVERFARGDDTGVKSNIAGHIQHKLGDVEAGFRQAEVIVEREFTTQSVHHGYIEPHVSTASWSSDGHLTLWTSTQGAFAIRSSTAAILGMPESQVKVIPMEIGGGFGGKAVTYLDPVAAVLAKKSGRPVKIVMTRREVFEGTGPSSATHMRAKIGATKDGTITAGQLYLAFEAGAFPGSPVGGGALTGFGPYKIAHLLVDGYDVVCNKQKVQGYRAPGQSQATLAVETVIDELVEQLGMDPMEFRLKNAVQAGDLMPNGAPHAPFGCRELEEAMLAHPHYDAPLTDPNQGRGRGLPVAGGAVLLCDHSCQQQWHDQPLHVGRFVLKIDSDGPVFTRLVGSVAHGSPSGQMVNVAGDPQWGNAFTISRDCEGVGTLPRNSMECGFSG